LRAEFGELIGREGENVVALVDQMRAKSAELIG
jgi:hypothetical protein